MTASIGIISRVLILTAFFFVLACSDSSGLRGNIASTATAAPDLTGTNWDGKRFALGQHGGKVALVFFGYAGSPESTHATFVKLKQISEELGPDASKVSIVMISVDPKRDVPALMAAYVPAFNKSFVGLRLEDEALAQALSDFGATATRREPAEGEVPFKTAYLIDHTTDLFVIDGQGNLRERIEDSVSAEDIRHDIDLLLAE